MHRWRRYGQVLLLIDAVATRAYRTIFVDAVNGRNVSLADVAITVSVNGRMVATQAKRTQGYTRIEVHPPDKDVTLNATWHGLEAGPVTLAPERTEWRFRFEQAGAPAVLLVCALPLETHAVRSTLDERDAAPTSGPPGDPNLYWAGAFKDGVTTRRVLVATSGMGNNNAAIVATHALRSFRDDIEHIVMIGIAGGCPNPSKPSEHVRLGDIVVLNEHGLVQYDFVKRTGAGDAIRVSPQRPSRALLDAAGALDIRRRSGDVPWLATMTRAAKSDPGLKRPAAALDLLHDVHGNKISHPKQGDRKPRMPMVHRGAIGSANILLKDPAARDRIRDEFLVRAVEMEGSGVLDAGWHVDKDIMVVRGVCDYCDAFKNDKWQPYAALVAAAYARALVETLPADLFR